MLTDYFASLVRGCRAAWYWVREFFGENDYPRYVAEWQARHVNPSEGDEHEHRLMTEREFFEERLLIKFGEGVQRC